jgi:hyperosmotically inducible periplasmic protein
MRTWKRLGLVVLVLLLAPTVDGQPAQDIDQTIKAQIEARLVEEGLVGVAVDVEIGTVTLRGEVASLYLKNWAVEQAGRVCAVANVVSMLTVLDAEGDDWLAIQVVDAIDDSSQLSIFDDVSVRVVNGTVTLTGAVVDPTAAQAFAKAASQVPGVQDLENQIELLPVSMSDDALRYDIATAIYRHPTFAEYPNGRRDPVHIIVRRGHVTLTGTVGSEVERRVAEVLARQAFGARSVNNQLRLKS